MKHWLKSNSILVAVDFPSQEAEDRRGLAFIGLQDNFGFSVEIPRNAEKQIGSQVFAVNSITYAPDISFDLSFLPTRKFDTENILGLNFGFNPTFESVFLGKSDVSFNVYLFISSEQSYDFIKQLRDNQSLNGVECIALGNCYLTRYGFSMAATDLARASASLVASNMEASVVSNDKVRVPWINFQTGEKLGDYSLILDWPQLKAALDEIEIGNQPILPTTEVKFGVLNSNLNAPSAILSPLKDAKIQSLDFGVTIPRETSYGFASNFPYSRKIKYPVEGQLNLSTVFSSFNSGSFTGMMETESKYNFQLDFLDPQEVFLSGKSFAELSGFLATGVSGATGFFTESRSLFISGANISNWRQDFPINNLSSFEVGLSFQCSENGGLYSRYGISNSAQPYWIYSPEARKIYDSNGNLITHDNFLYVYGPDCQKNYVLDGDGHLILADNWVEQDNICPYLPTTTPAPVPPPSPAPDIISITDNNPNLAINWVQSNYTTGFVVQVSEDGAIYEDSVVGVLEEPPVNLSSTDDYVRGNESYYFFRVVAYGSGGMTTGSSQSIYIP